MMDTCERQIKKLKAEVQQRRDDEERRQFQDSLDQKSDYAHREREREEAARERKESLRFPSDWREAFSNAIYLYREEARHFPEPSGYFEGEIKATEAARVIYNEEMAAIQPQVDALRAQIDSHKRAARNAAAARTEALYPNSVIAEALRENEPSYLTNW